MLPATEIPRHSRPLVVALLGDHAKHAETMSNNITSHQQSVYATEIKWANQNSIARISRTEVVMNRSAQIALTVATAALVCPAATAKTWQQLVSQGESQYQNGELKAAESSFNEAMKECRSFPADDVRVARTQNNLGVVLEQSGKYAEAESLYKKALQIRQAKLGKNDPAIADTVNNLANLYKDRNKYTEAEPLYMKAIAIYSTVPKSGANLAMAWNNLSVLHSKQGKMAQAESDLKRGIEYGEKSLRVEDDHLIEMTARLAELYDKAGKSDEAKPYFKKYMRGIYKVMEVSADDPDAHAKAEKFAAALRRTGQQADADLVEKALKYDAK